MKKKYNHVLFLILFFIMSNCFHFEDEKIAYPYQSKVENIRGNLKDNFSDLTMSYMETLQEQKKTDDKKLEILRKDILKMMDKQLLELYHAEKYGEAIRIADTLTNLGYTEISVSQEDCYRSCLNSIKETSNIFAVRELKNIMADKGIFQDYEVAELLNEYYYEKSPGLYYYHLKRYLPLYPSLLLKYPDLTKQANNLKGYSNLDFEQLMKSVVTVILDKGITFKNGMGGQDKSLGTGFFIDKDGYILTNHHVIAEHVDPKYEGYTSLKVCLRDDPDTEIPAKVIGWDKVYDVALLKIIGRGSPHYLTLGISTDMKIGDKIYTIGNPIGIRYTVTSGIISNREIDIFQMGQAFQVDAAINPGNSGGPLIDEKGQVVGIVFAGIPQFAGISFAIPFEWVRQTIPLLYKGGEVERSWLGAGIYQDREKQTLSFYYLMPGGGADIAGIQEEDELIGINGRTVGNLNEAQSLIAWEKAGTIVALRIKRGEEILEVPVRLDKRPYIPVETIFRKDSHKNIICLLFGLKLNLSGRMFGVRTYKIEKTYKGLPAYSLDISEGDPISVYGLKYYPKEKMVVFTLRYTNRDVSLMERGITLSLPAEINNIL